MKITKKPSESISEIKRQRTARRNTLIVVALLFIAMLGGSASSTSEKLSTGDIAWGILSIIAFAILLWSLYISYKQADERQQLIQLKANSLAFMAVIFGTVTAQILHALNIVKLETALSIIVIGGILLWTSLLKAVERRSN